MSMNNKILNSRNSFEKLGSVYNKAEDIEIKREIIEGVTCYLLHNNKNVGTNKLVIYLHGGCFVLGSIHSHQALVSHIAGHLALPVLFIEYSLAPEKPFPAAIIEIEQVYKYILQQNPEQDIIFMGDSAGAGLAISVLSGLNAQGIKSPAYLIMLSPWTDLTCNNESLRINAPFDPVLSKKALQYYTKLYVSTNDLHQANPIENICGPFPPTLIITGSGEVLLDDSKILFNKIANEQSNVKLSIYEKQNHVWMLENIYTRESRNALNEIKNFIYE